MDEIRASSKTLLFPADIAGVMGCDPHAIRIKAANGTLPFPYFRSGNRTKIPRKPFLIWLEGYENPRQCE